MYRRSKRVVPGFGITMGFTLTYLSLIVLIPLGFLFLKSAKMSLQEIWGVVSSMRVLASFRLSLLTSLVAASINCVFGFLVAWVLGRYEVPGKKIIDALVDLPFALPTAVAGIALTTIYCRSGWIGRLSEPLGIKIAFTPIGIIVALTFIGLPFVVRTVQPVLQEFTGEAEEASASLGANRWQTFSKVTFPVVYPALLTGFAMAFARAVGEYGSVVFISGNMPLKTEIPALLIITKLEQYDVLGATTIAVMMLLVSFTILLSINIIQWRLIQKLH